MRRIDELKGGLVALGTLVLHFPVELGSVGWVAKTIHGLDYTGQEMWFSDLGIYKKDCSVPKIAFLKGAVDPNIGR